MYGSNPYVDGIGEFLAGIEVELESVESNYNVSTFFTPTSDGSFRNHGMEYVSIPATPEKLVKEFTDLHQSIDFFNEAEKNTHRTSIHVHVNCRHLTEEQVKNLLLLYVIFEEYFFLYVKPERKNNIHCVPLTETSLSRLYFSALDNLVRQWSKYTALNLLPLKSYGSIEFRHLHGTDDPNVLKEWLQIIQNLWELSRCVTVDNLSLNKHTIALWFSIIFGGSSLGHLTPTIESLTKNGLLDTKLSLLKTT